VARVLVLVVVISVGGMPVPVVYIVDVPIVRRGLVPAAGAVHVVMTSMGEVGQWMFVVVVLVRSVRVPLVYVIDVTLTLDAGVPAARSVLVIAVGVFWVICVIGARHGSSLLC
jgi:hypothetical protein